MRVCDFGEVAFSMSHVKKNGGQDLSKSMTL